MANRVFKIRKRNELWDEVPVWEVSWYDQDGRESQTFKSEREALEFKERMERVFPQRQRYGRTNRRSTTGVVGVTRHIQKHSGKHTAWCARVTLPQGSRQVLFAISKYGAEKACSLAIALRKEWENDPDKAIERWFVMGKKGRLVLNIPEELLD